MLEFIKNIRRRKVIRNLKALPREKRIDNIQEIRSIGIICPLNTEENWNILDHFIKTMEGQGKEVHLMATQERDIDFIVTHQATTICRTRRFLNFSGLPSRESIKAFTCRHYDLLIDALDCEDFFSQYVALRTVANLKVVYGSPSEEASDIFDLIIRGDGPMEIKGFFDNIIEYLGMIKK